MKIEAAREFLRSADPVIERIDLEDGYKDVFIAMYGTECPDIQFQGEPMDGEEEAIRMKLAEAIIALILDG